MKAFLVGLLFLGLVLIMSGVGLLLFPLLLVLTFFLRILVGFALVLFAVWLLGKFILLLWGTMDKKKINDQNQNLVNGPRSL